MNEEIKENIVEQNIVKEMHQSFIDYSMSVIMARAIPDLRDGLKPVHRRILFTMLEEPLTPDKAYSKCAATVGSCLKKYHPHGDTSVYDALVRMAQDFSYRYPLVDGHGNFGTVYGHQAAAYRYTESKLTKMSMEMLRDINKDTVDFSNNFDNTRKEPVTLPSRYPNILVNGTMGIAVGMATNIPPHNLCEVIDACVAYIDNSEVTLEELMEHVKGPDFPTYGIILGNSGIKKAYETGKGSITVRARTEIEESNGKTRIVITQIPYQVNLTSILEKLSEVIKEKTIDGISGLADETSQKNGIRIVVEVKKEANANVVLNNLYKHTQLQTSFGINLLMLVNGTPRTLGLKEILKEYINYQQTVIVRRTRYELDQAQKRAHILEGLKIALDNIDAVIKLIRASDTDEEAKNGLKEQFGLTDIQSEAILEMKLRRLTGLEKDKIEEELEKLSKLISELTSILSSDEKIMNIIKAELLEIKEKYGDVRRTEIDMTAIDYIEDESLIPNDEVVITLTNKGYIKRITTETYRTQNRGGVGIKGMTTNDEDFVENIISLNSHDYVLFFTNKGKVYRIKGYEIPLFSRQSKGLPIVNLLPISQDEYVTAMLSMSKEDEHKYIVFCTQKGLIKRTKVEEFENIRTTGKIAITLKDDDELTAVRKTTGLDEILIASSNGRMIRFKETEIRIMGRTASGVKGISLDGGKVVGCEIASNDQEVLVVTEKGYGKKTNLENYRMTHRGSKGVKALNITNKNGNIVAFKMVLGKEDLMIMTDSGIIIRLSLEQVSTTGRVAQGVKLINLKDDQKVSTVAIMEKADEEEINTDLENEEKELQ